LGIRRKEATGMCNTCSNENHRLHGENGRQDPYEN